MDYLEKEWYDKLRFIGMSDIDAKLLARIKAKMERDRTFIDRIKTEGFSGFCRWVEINCRDIYYGAMDFLRYLWNKISNWL